MEAKIFFVTALEFMMEHSFATNVQLAGVLEALAACPQPVIAALVLYADALPASAVVPRLTRVLERLKSQIDAFASSADSFEALVRRGARSRQRGSGGNGGGGGSGGGSGGRVELAPKRAASTTPRPAFRHIQLARDGADATAAETRTKSCAYAAIVLSQLCQQLAAFAIEQNPSYIIA